MENHLSSNTGGRPPKDPKDKRSELLKTYVTPEEHEQINVKCSLAGMSVSKFLRLLALDKEITSNANPEELKKIRGELGKIGSNINQIARAVNSGKEFDEDRFKKMAAWLVQTLEEL